MVKLIHKERIAEGSTRKFLDGHRNDAPLRKGMVAKFRESHHLAAKLFAAGLSGNAVAEKLGYGPNWIAQLNNDPAFQELIAKYRNLDTHMFLEARDEFYTQGTHTMMAAMRHTAGHFEEADEAGELVPLNQSQKVMADLADRFGYGKRETKFNVNVDFADALQRAIKRSGKTIDGSVSEGTGGMKLVGSGLPTGREGALAAGVQSSSSASQELLAQAPSVHDHTPAHDVAGALPGDRPVQGNGGVTNLRESAGGLDAVRSAGAQPNGVVPPGAAEPRSLRRRLL